MVEEASPRVVTEIKEVIKVVEDRDPCEICSKYSELKLENVEIKEAYEQL